MPVIDAHGSYEHARMYVAVCTQCKTRIGTRTYACGIYYIDTKLRYTCTFNVTVLARASIS